MNDYKNFLNVAKDLAANAGKLCLEIQRDLGEVHYKSIKDIVTRADLASETLIVDSLRKAFPTHSIRTEESGYIEGSDKRFLWIIDPVDGTVNYSRGIPFWGISIALFFNGEPIVAAVNLPKLGELYTAIKGIGAFMNEKPICVSSVNEPMHALVSNGDFNVGDAKKINAANIINFANEATIFERVKCFGSAVVEGCFVACGRLDCFVMTMSYPWDIAAISLIISEANGKCSHIDGTPIKFEDSEQVTFSNAKLHATLIEAVCSVKKRQVYCCE